MNKREYLNSLLALCTDRQISVYNRMYPHGPKPSRISHAISQVESTLKNLNESDGEFRDAKKEFEERKGDLESTLWNLEKELYHTKKELKDAKACIDKLNRPSDLNPFKREFLGHFDHDYYRDMSWNSSKKGE